MLYMSDRDIVEGILTLAPGSKFEFINDRCVSAIFVDSENLFSGSIRRLLPTGKNQILNLVSKMEHLQHLNLNKNRLIVIPDLGLQNLTYLDLGSNYLGSVPDWIRKNPLQFLNLGVNNLNEIPDWFNELSELKVLKLHKNNLKNIDPISECKKLNSLNLYLNCIKKIPSFVWDFLNIEYFSWGVSGITSISEDIEKWTKLEWLSLVANKLIHLPNNICKLNCLKGLRLNKNQLIDLPENIGHLTNLEQISLYRNKLTKLPISFQDLNLRKINIAYNPFDVIPEFKSDWACITREDCRWEQ